MLSVRADGIAQWKPGWWSGTIVAVLKSWFVCAGTVPATTLVVRMFLLKRFPLSRKSGPSSKLRKGLILQVNNGGGFWPLGLQNQSSIMVYTFYAVFTTPKGIT